MNLITTKEAAIKWNITIRRGQVPAKFKLGDIWVIPEDMPKPIDGRTKAAKEMLKDNKR